MLTLLENVLNVDIFTHAPRHSILAPSYCHHTLGRGKLLILPGSHFFKNLFPTTAESGGGNYDFLYQNLIKKYKDDLDHWAIYF